MKRYLKLCNRIRVLREFVGYTQNELAFACDISRTYLSRLENNKAECSAYLALKLCFFLDVSFENLFYFADKM